MNEIDFVAAAGVFEKARFRAGGEGQGAPPDVGHLEGRAPRRFVRQRLHRALHKAQALVQAPLGAGIQQHLHAEADAQERRTLPCLLQKRLHQPLAAQLGHAVGESAHAGQHQRPGAQDVPRFGGKAHIRAAVFQRTAHAQKIAAPVVHHCYHRPHRLTSTPRARMAAAAWVTGSTGAAASEAAR